MLPLASLFKVMITGGVGSNTQVPQAIMGEASYSSLDHRPDYDKEYLTQAQLKDVKELVKIPGST